MRLLIVAITGLLMVGAADAQSFPADKGPTTVPAVATSLPTPTTETATSRPATTLPSGVSSADFSLEQSLLHSAVSLAYAPDGTPARGARMLALCQAAQKLYPTDPKLNALLANIYEIQEDFDKAAAAVKVQLDQSPNTHELGLAYLRLGEQARSSVKDRLEFLLSVAEDKNQSPSLRAQAYSNMGDLYLRQSDRPSAEKVYKQALDLDSQLPSAIIGQLAMLDKKDTGLYVQTLLSLIKASPTYSGAARELGAAISKAGLQEQAVGFLGYAWQLDRRDSDRIDEGLALQYFDVLLDAGQYRQAVEIMVPVMDKMKSPSPEFLSLLLEAYVGVNDKEKVLAVREALRKSVDFSEEAVRTSPALLREMAWYLLVSDVLTNEVLRVHTARDAALKAIEDLKDAGKTDALLQLTRAAADAKIEALRPADVRSDEPLKKLQQLATNDPYAAYFLAEQMLKSGNDKANPDRVRRGAEILRNGLSLGYGGRAWRLLSQIAHRHSIPQPTTQSTKVVGDLVEAWLKDNQPTIDMAMSPEKYLAVTISPTQRVFEALKPIEVEVKIRNISGSDIPMGASGLCSPVVRLSVIANSRGITETFDNLPLAVLPCSRMLKAGEEVSTTVRIDVGELEAYLQRRPLDISSFIVSGMLDPVQRGKKTESSVPTLSIDRSGFYRVDVLGQFDRQNEDWTKQYQRMLGLTVGDFQRGTLDDRMAAARRIGSLLTMAADTYSGKLQPPKMFATTVQQPVLLTMFREILKDPNMQTRQEAINALAYCAVDGRVAKLLGAVMEDPEPLVRLRLVELLGCAKPPDFRKMLKRFQEDKDPMVRLVATAMLEQRADTKQRP